jgi:hypothetical protein
MEAGSLNLAERVDVRRSATVIARGRIWYVRFSGHEEHSVRFIRRLGVRRWMCDCKHFFHRLFEQKKHCNHIKEVLLYTGRSR